MAWLLNLQSYFNRNTSLILRIDNRFPGMVTSWALLVKSQQDKRYASLMTILRRVPRPAAGQSG